MQFLTSRSRGILLVALFFSLCHGASAGVMFISGDINIAHPIDGSQNATVTPGNTKLFENILGTSRNVLISDESLRRPGALAAVNAINTLYDNMPGITSSIDTSQPLVNDTLLTGVDLFIAFLPSNGFQQSEVDALRTFLQLDGTVFIIADIGGALAVERNIQTNDALERLGSSLRLDNVPLDSGFTLTTNIDADPFTDGISSIQYAYVTSISGGTSLIRTGGGATFVAYERITAATVPEPASLATWACFTVPSVIGFRRRRHSSTAA